MKIGIVTQPLLGNYGGILQNYALQTILRRLGHEPITIDYFWSRSLYSYLKSTVKSLFLYPFPKKRRLFIRMYDKRLNPDIDTFVSRFITTTKTVYRYMPRLVDRYKLDVLITGSDQVWRPIYNPHLPDMFLDFSKNKKVSKIAYAASFGTSAREYSDKNIADCIDAAKRLSAVSVRESSGVELCRDYFDIEAKTVLDPTLLLTKDDYIDLTEDISAIKEKYVGVYVLDENPDIDELISKVCREKGIRRVIKYKEDENKVSPKEWIALFRDAEFIVTDSFHGTVFSIIFQKAFVSISNSSRGADRFLSLLKPLGLMNRLVINGQKGIEGPIFGTIDWKKVNNDLYERRIASIKFIKSSLDKLQ